MSGLRRDAPESWRRRSSGPWRWSIPRVLSLVGLVGAVDCTGEMGAPSPDAGVVSDADATLDSGDGDADADPCEGLDCSGHGLCEVQRGRATCACDEGYHAAGLTCVDDAVADPCEGVTCADHGACTAIDSAAICVCDDGFHADDLDCVADASSDGIKWHPGNYLFTGHPSRPEEVAKALDSPFIKGIQVRYFWSRPNGTGLERGKGVYDFSGIEANLEAYQAKGKRLHLIVFEQDYWGIECTPRYMWDRSDPDYDPVYQGGHVISGDRCVPKLWVPAVMDRLIALYDALGERFDREPYFEAVSMGETAAPSFGDPAYSDRALVDQLVREQEALVKAFPHTLAFMGANWCPHMDELVASAYNLGIGIDGPDLFVTGDTMVRTTQGYPCFNQSFMHESYGGDTCHTDYYGRMPLGMGGQLGLEYSIQAGYTMEEIYNFALLDPERLRLNYMAWWLTYMTPGFTFDGTILPYIESVEGAMLNTECPENIESLRGGCNTE